MSTTLTTEQVEEILAGCEGVTPGPWTAFYKHKYDEYHVGVGSGAMKLALFSDGCPTENPQLDSEHIARLDPQTVSSLATELLALRKRVGELEGAHTKAVAEATAQFHRAQSAERNLARRIGPDGIGIKGLEWRELTSPREDGPPEPIGEWEADSAVGIYIIKDEGGEWWLGLATVHDTVQIGRSSDPDILRSKAQADFEARIRSALTSPASGERDAPAGYVLAPVEPTPEMLRAGMDDLGWWVEPYEAPRESGVPIDSDMSAEDAAVINAQQIEVVASCYRAMLAAALRMEGK